MEFSSSLSFFRVGLFGRAQDAPGQYSKRNLLEQNFKTNYFVCKGLTPFRAHASKGSLRWGFPRRA